MSGKILLKALELLYDGAMTQVDFFGAVLSAGYGAGSSKIDYEYQQLRKSRKDREFQARIVEDRKNKLRAYISKMKHDGLIKESNNKFTISDKGKVKLGKLRNSLPERHYNSDTQINPIIISFDIPERFRRKRDWLREVVKNLGFKMVHQSVWIGNVKIPKDFIFDLENLKILEFIEIFEISRTGSLKKLT